MMDREYLCRRIVVAAMRAVEAADYTDDGMVELKWDEFIPLKDAVDNFLEWAAQP
jgi:hypothetical protein